MKFSRLCFNKNPNEIKLTNIFNAVDEKLKQFSVKRSKKGCNGKSTKCITHNLWDELENHINVFLKKKFRGFNKKSKENNCKMDNRQKEIENLKDYKCGFSTDDNVQAPKGLNEDVINYSNIKRQVDA